MPQTVLCNQDCYVPCKCTKISCTEYIQFIIWLHVYYILAATKACNVYLFDSGLFDPTQLPALGGKFTVLSGTLLFGGSCVLMG